jgi:hypothetical protein
VGVFTRIGRWLDGEQQQQQGRQASARKVREEQTRDDDRGWYYGPFSTRYQGHLPALQDVADSAFRYIPARDPGPAPDWGRLQGAAARALECDASLLAF